MNPIHRFIHLPMWVILAVLMLRQPIAVDTVADYAEWMTLFRNVTSSIRWNGRNRVERWLIGKVLDWVTAERRAFDELEALGIKVVQNV